MAQIGYGVQFFYGDATTATSVTATTEITKLQDFVPATEKGAKVVVKYHNAPGDRAVMIPGPLVENDDAKATFVYASAEYIVLKGLINTPKSFKIKYSDFSTDTFQGFIYEVGKPTPLESEMQVEVTLAVSGEIVFATATA
jgi:hypothetical protein